MDKQIAVITVLAALTMSGCFTSANRTRGGEPFFKNSDRAMIYEVPVAMRPKVVAEGDNEEAPLDDPYDPSYRESDPRTDHNPGLLGPGAVPPTVLEEPEQKYGVVERITSPPETTEDSDEGILGTVVNWVVPRTTLTIANNSTCVAEISVNGNKKVVSIPPMGGRRSVDLAGQVGSEAVVIAAGQCWAVEPMTGQAGWQYKGMAIRRICAPYQTDRVDPWIVSSDDFREKPIIPPPCQGPEPVTYPYYPAEGWNTWRGGWGRGRVNININNRRGWRHY